MDARDGDTTTAKAPPPSDAVEALSLQFMTDRGALTVTLPAEGSLVIGRSADADIRLDHSSVSRRHARVHIGPPLTLEDLDSRNGTSLYDRSLAGGERATVGPGEVFFVGEVPCFLRGGARAPQHKLWVVERVRKKIDAHCAAGASSASALCLLRVRVTGLAHERFEAEILDAVGDGDVVAPITEGREAFVLPFNPHAARTESLSALLRTRLGGAGRAVHLAVATYPRHGADAAALMAHTKAVLDGAARAEHGPDVVVLSPAMQRLHAKLERVARGSISVLLLGEMGVGKEVFASQVHALSPRASKPYVKFNCAAFTETLVDGELFGHEKGAFTGAASARAGLIEAADGGTVFLDEVGELPPSVQAKLLRALEARCVRRVGATHERPVDVRFVAATNRDLEAECAAGRFRRDLYFRLKGVSLEIPPLRERAEEIEALARMFLRRAAAQAGTARPPSFTAEALAALQRHPWPGNLRELRNAVECAVLVCDGEVITAADLELDAPSPASSTSSDEDPPTPSTLSAPEQDECARVVHALALCGGNQTKAAQRLGMSRKALIARVVKYNIPRPHTNLPK